jgi:hypothetical protein
MPAAVAISAATTFDRIPPDPRGDVAWPIRHLVEASKSVTSRMSSAAGSVRGSPCTARRCP